MLIGFVIWSLVAAFLAGLGFICRKASKPVAFFTGVESPRVSDVKGYNRAVSRLWFTAAIVLEVIALPLLYAEQNEAGIVLMIPVVVIGMIMMMVAYTRIELRYTKNM